MRIKQVAIFHRVAANFWCICTWKQASDSQLGSLDTMWARQYKVVCCDIRLQLLWEAFPVRVQVLLQVSGVTVRRHHAVRLLAVQTTVVDLLTQVFRLQNVNVKRFVSNKTHCKMQLFVTLLLNLIYRSNNC